MEETSEPEGKRRFLTHLELIQDRLAALCWRKKLRPEDESEFRSYTMLRLIRDDYRILRRYQGKSSLSTYLDVVLLRLLNDFWIANRGRWRPSSVAQRLGPIAEEIERHTHRDGLHLEEAVEAIRSDLFCRVSRGEIEALAGQLPDRPAWGRKVVELGETLQAPEDSSQAAVDRDRARTARHLRRALRRAVASLSREDLRILRMRFFERQPIAKIARSTKRDVRALYRQIPRSLKGLRRELEHQGVRLEEIRDLFGWDRLETVFDAGASHLLTGGGEAKGEKRATA